MQPSRRQVLAAGLALTLSPFAAADAPPTTGEADDGLKPFDDLVLGFLDKHKAPGAALAISRNGKLVHARGYGFADLDRKTPVEPNARFRIASVSKPLTAVAVMKLVEQGKLGLDDKILDRIPAWTPPAGTEMDPRWKKVTVRMCLQHTGGWDRAKSFDPIGRFTAIAKAFDTKTPVPPELVIRYMLGQPFDFEPGARYAYANLDYLLLGRAIEKATGQGYEAFVQKEVFAPLGVTAPQLGRALPENRAAGEVTYYDHKRRQGACIYPPHVGKMVPIPDGAENFEGYEAHGGWIASAVDLVRFAAAFDDPKACPLLKEATIATMWERPAGEAGHEADGKPKPAYYGCGWNFRPAADGRGNAWHGGLISGTSTLLYRRSDNLCWAVLFNTDRTPDGQVLSGLIEGPLNDTAAKVRAWPERDLFAKYLTT